MIFLSWNCHGFGNPTAIRVLVDLVHSTKPKVLFFMETLMDGGRMEPVCVQLGYKNMFVVNSG